MEDDLLTGLPGPSSLGDLLASVGPDHGLVMLDIDAFLAHKRTHGHD